eukprot:15908149-Heterocapsa_arctica.AAC.1
MVHEPLRQLRVILAAPLEQDPGLLADVLLVVARHLVDHHRAHHLAELGRKVVELAMLAQAVRTLASRQRRRLRKIVREVATPTVPTKFCHAEDHLGD